MLSAFADKLAAARAKQGRWWKVWAAVLVVAVVVVAAVVIWWRRQAAARAAHEAYVAGIDARRAADDARAAEDLAKVDELREVAAAAQRRADVAAAEAKASQGRYEDDLAAIARVRSWDDVGRDR
jgi:hypothetical protein